MIREAHMAGFCVGFKAEAVHHPTGLIISSQLSWNRVLTPLTAQAGCAGTESLPRCFLTRRNTGDPYG